MPRSRPRPSSRSSRCRRPTCGSPTRSGPSSRSSTSGATRTSTATRACARCSPPAARSCGMPPTRRFPTRSTTATRTLGRSRWPTSRTTSCCSPCPSRYCLPDMLGNEAWKQFADVPPGYSRVQAICDHVHEHLTFQYGSSTATSTALDVYTSGYGVCRDFTHLAISFCRALNIPARYAFGYLRTWTCRRTRRRWTSRRGWRSGSTTAGGPSIRATTSGARAGSSSDGAATRRTSPWPRPSAAPCSSR